MVNLPELKNASTVIFMSSLFRAITSYGVERLQTNRANSGSVERGRQGVGGRPLLGHVKNPDAKAGLTASRVIGLGQVTGRKSLGGSDGDLCWGPLPQPRRCRWGVWLAEEVRVWCLLADSSHCTSQKLSPTNTGAVRERKTCFRCFKIASSFASHRLCLFPHGRGHLRLSIGEAASVSQGSRMSQKAWAPPAFGKNFARFSNVLD